MFSNATQMSKQLTQSKYWWGSITHSIHLLQQYVAIYMQQFCHFVSSKYWACYYHFNNVCWTIQWFFLYDEILFRYMIDSTLEAVLEENHLATLSPIADDIGLVIATCNFARRAKKSRIFCWSDISYDRKHFLFWSKTNSHPFKVTIYQGKPDAILWVYSYISCVERCLFSLILANACNKSRLY